MIGSSLVTLGLVGPRKVGGTWSAVSAWTLPPLSVSGTAGLDFNPGSDVDVDLITVGVTGAPKIYWDESFDGFRSAKTFTIPALNLVHSSNPYLQFLANDTTPVGNLQLDSGDMSLAATGARSLLLMGGVSDNEGITLQARDIDGAAWVTVIRVQNANVVELGFFAATPVVKQTGCLVPTDLTTSIAAITALRTALNNYGLTTVET